MERTTRPAADAAPNGGAATSANGVAPVLFSAAGLRAVELTDADIPLLQRFFEANPEYFHAVNGAGPGPNEAQSELHSELPAGWPYTRWWIPGFFDDARVLHGMAGMVEDLLAPGVWHIGLFMVATPAHGTGLATTLYGALEAWAKSRGAQWLRLGVVAGNVRAERFWERNGYVESRTRTGIAMGSKVNTVRVMIKPLAGGALASYRTLVPRDRPDPA